MDLARRAHQSPGRLVDEDGLRGLPLAQRTGQGQSGVVAFLVWELVRLQEPLRRRRRDDGLFVTLCRQDCESRWRHTSIELTRGTLIRTARTRACTRTVYTYTPGEQGRELQLAASAAVCIHRLDLHTVTAITSHVINTHVQLRPAGTKRARAVGCN